ncbi:MAG: DUF2066 domain-containing protein [Aestuariivirga sp.]
MTNRKLLMLSGFAGFVLCATILAIGWLVWNGTVWQMLGGSNELYAGRTIITGQRDETRIPGFKAALLDVAKKVSGNQMLTADQIETIVHGNIKLFVQDFTDRDRMEDIPIHDEQGTRDRSFELLINFVPSRVNAMLRSLGEKPWKERRPKVLVLVNVHNAIGSYILTDDEDEETGAEQREAFKAAAWQAGIPLILPLPALLKSDNIDTTSLDQRSPSQLADLARMAQADVVITGNLIWVGGPNGWKANWVLFDDKGEHRWQIEGINFDGAFRNAMRGAAQILSQHGEPPPNLN